jgi:hypothetical protein
MQDLMHDPVYKDFVFLGWQDEMQARIAAEKQAEIEKQVRIVAEKQAKIEAQRAERLAAQLRALGIEPDAH